MTSNETPKKDAVTNSISYKNKEQNPMTSSPMGNIICNPIMSGAPISSRTSANKLYSTGSTRSHLSKQANVGFQEIMRLVNDAFLNKNDLSQLFYSLNNIMVNKLQVSFSAIGLYNKHSNCVNIKLIDKIGSTYTTKIIMTEENNPVVKAIKTKNSIVALK